MLRIVLLIQQRSLYSILVIYTLLMVVTPWVWSLISGVYSWIYNCFNVILIMKIHQNQNYPTAKIIFNHIRIISTIYGSIIFSTTGEQLWLEDTTSQNNYRCRLYGNLNYLQILTKLLVDLCLACIASLELGCIQCSLHPYNGL